VCVGVCICVLVSVWCGDDASQTTRSLVSAVAVDEGVCIWVGVCMCVLVSAWCGFDTGQTTRSLISAVAVDEGVCVWMGGWVDLCVCARGVGWTRVRRGGARSVQVLSTRVWVCGWAGG